MHRELLVRPPGSQLKTRSKTEPGAAARGSARAVVADAVDGGKTWRLGFGHQQTGTPRLSSSTPEPWWLRQSAASGPPTPGPSRRASVATRDAHGDGWLTRGTTPGWAGQPFSILSMPGGSTACRLPTPTRRWRSGGQPTAGPRGTSWWLPDSRRRAFRGSPCPPIAAWRTALHFPGRR